MPVINDLHKSPSLSKAINTKVITAETYKKINGKNLINVDFLTFTLKHLQTVKTQIQATTNHTINHHRGPKHKTQNGIIV